MTTLKTYRRKLPLYVKARPLLDGEIVYDGEGKLIEFQPGDMLIEQSNDRFKLDGELFHQLYEEVETQNGSQSDRDSIRQASTKPA